MEIQEGRMKLTSKGGDPFVFTRDIKSGNGPFVVSFRMKSNSKGNCQIFWMTEEEKTFFRDRSVVIKPEHDNQWHGYELKFPVEKALAGFRIDPSNAPGEILIENLRIIGNDGAVLAEWFAPSK